MPPHDARPPLPEPIFSETISDLDGTQAGEAEYEANGSVLRSRRGGAYALDTSLEGEWLVTRRLGVRLEPTLSLDRDAGMAGATGEAGLSAGASWKLLQDFAGDFYLQTELLTRAPWSNALIVQPGDPAEPVVLDLRGGVRRADVTLRWGIGVGAGTAAAYAPLRASVSVLRPFDELGRFGFFGVELDYDGARQSPALLALNVVPNLEPAGLPFRFGLALPWAVGAPSEQPSLGIFIRIFHESERETEFGKGKR